MGCDTCARRMYCPLYRQVRPPCPYYVADPFVCWVRQLAPIWHEVVSDG